VRDTPDPELLHRNLIDALIGVQVNPDELVMERFDLGAGIDMLLVSLTRWAPCRGEDHHHGFAAFPGGLEGCIITGVKRGRTGREIRGVAMAEEEQAQTERDDQSGMEENVHCSLGC